MLYYCSMELHYCKESPKKKKNVTQVQVQIMCKSCASIFSCFTLFFRKLFQISHEKCPFSRFQPDFSRYFGYFPVPFGVGVVEAAHSSRVTQTISSVHNRPEGLVWTLDCFLPEILFFIVKQCESFGCFCSDTLRHNYIQSYNAKRFPEIFSGNLFLCLLHIRF